jgi:ABC-2 type transport system permease protein
MIAGEHWEPRGSCHSVRYSKGVERIAIGRGRFRIQGGVAPNGSHCRRAGSLVGLGEVALVVTIGILWFRIPFVGNPFVLVLGTALFLLSALALGLLISTVCSTQQQAFSTNFFVLNPLFILSGFSFPISSMPQVLQWFTYINPLRYYLIVIRGTLLKGVGVSVLWTDFVAMGAIASVLLTLSILRFRKTLE